METLQRGVDIILPATAGLRNRSEQFGFVGFDLERNPKRRKNPASPTGQERTQPRRGATHRLMRPLHSCRCPKLVIPFLPPAVTVLGWWPGAGKGSTDHDVHAQFSAGRRPGREISSRSIEPWPGPPPLTGVSQVGFPPKTRRLPTLNRRVAQRGAFVILVAHSFSSAARSQAVRTPETLSAADDAARRRDAARGRPQVALFDATFAAVVAAFEAALDRFSPSIAPADRGQLQLPHQDVHREPARATRWP